MTGECEHFSYHIHFDSTPRNLRRELQNWLNQHLTNCPNCGALIPELHIIAGGNSYMLTCYQKNECEIHREIMDTNGFPIAKNTKVLQATDYKKFQEYLTLRGF